MNRTAFAHSLAPLALSAVLALAAPACAAPSDDTSFAVTGVRVFDGERTLQRATVVVRDGRIAAVGTDSPVPDGVEVVDGTGATLLPGLIDAHTHTFGDALERALVFGVTTELDMFTDHRFAAAMRAGQADGGAPGRADLFSAGTLVTAAGGHGTQFGLPIPTLDGPDGAAAFVADRLAEGSDWIKIVYESATPTPIPTIDRATLSAVIDATHAQDALAVVHATSHDGFVEAVEEGADGLIHVFRDRAPVEDLASRTKAAGAFVIPTLTVLSRFGAERGGESLGDDPALQPYLRSGERKNLEASFHSRPGSTSRIEHALEVVRRLHAAGVPILAGTDAPNPGTVHGASLHEEMAMLVRAGLTPAEALAAATSAPADAFGLADRGRIAPGLRADLVLVEGDPTREITATRSIRRVWKAGHAVERRPVEEGAEEGSSEPGTDGIGPGELAGFEDGMTARAGFGWQETTDEMMGGASSVEVTIADGGAGGSGKALAIEGEIRAGFMFPWAGAMYFPSTVPMEPADLSATRGVAFETRGDGGTYRLLVFAESLGQMPASASFEAGPEWARREVTWEELGLDGRGVTGLVWTGGPEPGAFTFSIDEVELVE